MDNGASAAKVCGAGGGGCILFYAENKKELMKKFNNKLITFKFDFEGLKVWKR
jgi:D-glycero-alpha-D-manno-heptose-7-phosphate kinase